ncbi:hypothetical protein MBLNU457_g1093t1 [Dothideomycetes sp. NU457]
MAVAEMRMSSILPTIKCSSCGDEIQISMMGEHVCSTTKQTTEIRKTTLSPKSAQHPFARPTRKAAPQTQRNVSEPVTRTTRAPPPRIDPLAANRPYAQRDHQGAGALGTRSNDSPLSPVSDNGYGGPRRPSATRSATNPNPRSVFAQPPSPLLSSNLDCAFPPFLSPSFPPSRPGSPKSNVSSPKAPSMFEANGFRKPRQESLSSAVSRSETRSPAPPEPSLQELRQQEKQKDARLADQSHNTHESSFPQRTRSREEQKTNTARSPPTSQNTSPNLTPGPLDMNKTRPPPTRPSRPGDVDGFLVKMKDEAEKESGSAPNLMRPDMRSHTFPTKQMPLAQQEPAVHRRPSEPVHQFSRPFRAPERLATPNASSVRPAPPVRAETMPYQSSTCVASRSPPPRNPSRNAHRPEVRTQPLAPTGSTAQYAHANHTPSDSGSSSLSAVSTSSASPPLSVASSMSGFSTDGDKTAQVIPPIQETKQWLPPQRAYAPLVRAATETAPNFSTPRAAKLASPPESPMDPMMLQPNFIAGAGRTPMASHNTAQDSQQDYFANVQPAPPVSSQPQSKPQPITPPAEPISRPSTATGKRSHTCRGCEQPIIGKSVKAADGRLTGRYHKSCFVCKTCSSPFTTGDFYVFDNDPYCEHHYHSLNDSLCTGCGRGIEGQYLESQTLQKFHPACLACETCKGVLGDDYFEVGGKVFCERHAFAAVRSAGGLGPKRDMERRTTRLMTMAMS